MRDLMIDIETLGTAPGSVILSIGAAAFDAVTGEFGEEFYAAIDPQSAVTAGLTMDVSTLKWWMTQSEEARRAAFSGERLIAETLSEFGDYVRRIDATRVWAKPPSFDLVLLEAAFSACGIPIPWHYRTPRDVRTLLDITGTTAQTGVGVAHNALDDAKSQATDVINSCRALAATREATEKERAVLRDLVDLSWEIIMAIDFGEKRRGGYLINTSQVDKIEILLSRMSALSDEGITGDKIEAALKRLLPDPLMATSNPEGNAP